MDIEQLKLVLATVQGVSGDAFKVGALYIGMQFLKELVFYGLWGSVVFASYKAAQLIAFASTSSDNAIQAIKRIRKALSINNPRGESNYDIGESTINETVACVEGLVKQLNAKEQA